MTSGERIGLERIFKPRGLALFGGLGTTGSFGHMILLSQIRYGYRGGLYPISAKGGETAGLKVYRSLDQVDGPVDLASISVPAKGVPDVLRDCLAHGLAGAQVHSSGFAETGEDEGRRLQREVADIAAGGIRIVGPNCFGVHCPAGGITLLPGSDFSRTSGPVALISQSGGVATDFGDEARKAGLGISKLVSYGNGCDLEAVSLLEYLADDPDTGFIGAYIEGVKDARRFMEVVRRIAPVKPVVVWKGGLTEMGGRAARSHTGSLAGKARLWTGALAQAGAVPVQGVDGLIDALLAISYLKKPGPRLALVGGGGATGVFSCDLAAEYGLQLPTFSTETQRRLRKLFPTPGNSMANPLDTGSPILPLDVVEGSLREVMTREPVDLLIMMLLLRPMEVEVHVFMEMMGLDRPPRGSYLEGVLDIISRLKRETGKDVAVVFDNRAHTADDIVVEEVARAMRPRYQAAGIPVYPSVERALRGIRHAIAASYQGRGEKRGQDPFLHAHQCRKT